MKKQNRHDHTDIPTDYYKGSEGKQQMQTNLRTPTIFCTLGKEIQTDTCRTNTPPDITKVYGELRIMICTVHIPHLCNACSPLPTRAGHIQTLKTKDGHLRQPALPSPQRTILQVRSKKRISKAIREADKHQSFSHRHEDHGAGSARAWNICRREMPDKP